MRKEWLQLSSLHRLYAAMYSGWQEDVATTVGSFDLQLTDLLFMQMNKLVTLLEVSASFTQSEST